MRRRLFEQHDAAVRARIAPAFPAAEGGLVFLNDIGELPIDLQVIAAMASDGTAGKPLVSKTVSTVVTEQ